MKFLRKPVVWALLVVAILAAITTAQSSTIKHQRQDIERYQVNHETLLADITQYRTVNGELVASVQALTLRNDELEHLIPKYTEEIEQLQLKVRDVQSVAHVTTEINAEVLAPLDTVRTPAPEPEYTDAPTPDSAALAFSFVVRQVISSVALSLYGFINPSMVSFATSLPPAIIIIRSHTACISPRIWLERITV